MNGLAIVGVIVAVIAIGIFAYRVQEKRKQALEAWARGLGLSFTRDSDSAMEDRYPALTCLREGDDRFARNIATGRRGKYGVRAFDYHYQTHSTDSKGNRNTTDHNFSAVVIETPLALKPLHIRSENVFDRVGEFLGIDDIDFESAEFSRQFHVTAPDRKWAFDVLHQEAMEFLLASPRFMIEFQDGYAVARHKSAFAPAEFDSALNVVSGLVDRLPQSVVRELGG
jgi:hypothetical protein